ncbi:mevalonate kinase [Nocardia tengchongensis]|uniref:mevalonate kinase n=1 Tax=Nocardia tengchongensis TaxID=2055889 RepID=UPI00361E0E8D
MTAVSPRRDVGHGSAHAKVILIGEHTVVHGSPAIALPIPALTVHARAMLAPDSAATQDSPAVPDFTAAQDFTATRGPAAAQNPRTAEGSTAVPDFPAAPLLPGGGAGVIRVGGPGFRPRTGPEFAVDAALRHWNVTDTPIAVHTESRIPVARGLGSSAASTAAAVRATAALLGRSLEDADLAAFVQVGEQHSHGRASGVDAAAAVSHGPIRFRAGVPTPIPITGRALLLVADTGVSAGTRRAVGIATARLTGQRGLEMLRSAEGLTEDAATQLAHGDWPGVGRSLTRFHELLVDLGVSSDVLDRAVGAALDAGALGAKLTGGGLGGCLLALADHPAAAARISERLYDSGVHQVWTLPIEGEPK